MNAPAKPWSLRDRASVRALAILLCVTHVASGIQLRLLRTKDSQ